MEMGIEQRLHGLLQQIRISFRTVIGVFERPEHQLNEGSSLVVFNERQHGKHVGAVDVRNELVWGSASESKQLNVDSGCVRKPSNQK